MSPSTFLLASISCESDDLFTGNTALLCDLPFERKPCVDAGAIRGDVNQRSIADLAQSRILGDQHVLILFECAFDFAEQLLGCFRFVLAMAVGRRPDEPACVLGLGCDAVENTQAKASVAVIVFVGSFADVAGAGKLQDARRRDIFEFTPAIHPAPEFHRLGVDAWRLTVEHPANEFHAVFGRGDLHLSALVGVDVTCERRLVNVGGVGLVEEVVGEQQVVAIDALRLVLVRPSRMPGIARNYTGVRKVGVAHPYPDQAIALSDGITADLGALRNKMLAGYFDTVSAAIENHAVILTADIVSEHLPAGERHASVAAAVFQRRDLTIGPPIEHHRFFEQRPRHRLFADFRTPGGYVPSVVEKHSYLPILAVSKKANIN